jgi:hypothetical protein
VSDRVPSRSAEVASRPLSKAQARPWSAAKPEFETKQRQGMRRAFAAHRFREFDAQLLPADAAEVTLQLIARLRPPRLAA